MSPPDVTETMFAAALLRALHQGETLDPLIPCLFRDERLSQCLKRAMESTPEQAIMEADEVASVAIQACLRSLPNEPDALRVATEALTAKFTLRYTDAVLAETAGMEHRLRGRHLKALHKFRRDVNELRTEIVKDTQKAS